MGWIEDKLALFAKNIDNFADAEVRKDVLAGSGAFNGDTTIEELAVWMKGAVERLCLLVGDDTATKIMIYNACRFVEETFMGDTVGELTKLKALYEKDRDVDEIIRYMNKDRSFNGASMFPEYERKGNVLYNTKKPCRLKEFEGAKDKYEKQLYYCYCPFVKATREKIPPVYCNCGAGFNKFIWEGVVEGEVNIKVVESILDGGDYCTFAIHLPE